MEQSIHVTAARQILSRVVAPRGNPTGVNDLPPSDTERWVIRRKAAVVAGVRAGLITIEEACERYTLSVEELLSWQRLIDNHGLRGLKATKIQDYRPASRATD